MPSGWWTPTSSANIQWMTTNPSGETVDEYIERRLIEIAWRMYVEGNGPPFPEVRGILDGDPTD
jgi:hypothetical protein